MVEWVTLEENSNGDENDESGNHPAVNIGAEVMPVPS